MAFMSNFVNELVEEINDKKISNIRDVIKLQNNLSRNIKPNKLPKLAEVLLKLNTNLKVKPVRTISGVAPVAIMTKPYKCPHGTCLFCPGGINSFFGDIPQSYTGNEPASIRAVGNNFDGYLQTFNRLENYGAINHNFQKVEMIIMGGTFCSMDKKYQEEFVTYALKALNDFSDMFFVNNKLVKEKFNEFFELPGFFNEERTNRINDKLLKLKSESNLLKEQKRNETSNIRCVALCVETKPDFGLKEHGNEMLRLGVTRVEVGVQSVYDNVLKFFNRGHTDFDTRKSLQELKDLGFKVSIHLMPGLISDKEKDLEGMKKIFSDSDYKPDMLKIYPCRVFPGTGLEGLYKLGKFKPITDEEAADLILEFKKIIPKYCRVQRINRDIPSTIDVKGIEHANLREIIKEKMKLKGYKCNCIRCREPKDRVLDFSKLKFKVLKYNASKGKEFFISANIDDYLIGFCRLRFPFELLREEITEKTGLIRELHVYSSALGLGEKNEESLQHKGIGIRLMKIAEKIALKNGKNKLLVLSGIGVKEYYSKKLDYKREGVYMGKDLYKIEDYNAKKSQ